MASMSLTSRLEGKVAIITASSSGIGFGIAQRFLQEGATVVISSRKQQNVDAAVSELLSQGLNKVIGIACHIGIEAERKNLVAQTLEKFKKIDILVNNAAINVSMDNLLEVPEKIWDKTMEINLKASLLLTREIVHSSMSHLGGSIVFISSLGGTRAQALGGVYSISKAALIAVSRQLALDLAGNGIRVNCVSPGIIKTKFSEVFWKDPQAAQANTMVTPLGRLGEVKDVAACVSFLVSKDADFITGENFVISGGYGRL
eukprot:TRINITY_DN6293_c0_g1_i1.p1 TRINITY_DN6293_c0_g1~~TRINITY_DN6293_c0_g1_i1.p1  ORF type:complete len:259 (+),score=63.30 TRINITY_DN6293_c0_g1_i1:45-821(+)